MSRPAKDSPKIDHHPEAQQLYTARHPEAKPKDPRISPRSPQIRRAQSRRSPHRWLLLAGFLLILTTAQAHAQGCAQCLDSTRATPPAVQAAYRHAIYLLAGVASTLFLLSLYLLRREP